MDNNLDRKEWMLEEVRPGCSAWTPLRPHRGILSLRPTETELGNAADSPRAVVAGSRYPGVPGDAGGGGGRVRADRPCWQRVSRAGDLGRSDRSHRGARVVGRAGPRPVNVDRHRGRWSGPRPALSIRRAAASNW